MAAAAEAAAAAAAADATAGNLKISTKKRRQVGSPLLVLFECRDSLPLPPRRPSLPRPSPADEFRTLTS